MDILRIPRFFPFIICLFYWRSGWIRFLLTACKLGELQYFDRTVFLHWTVFVSFQSSPFLRFCCLVAYREYKWLWETIKGSQPLCMVLPKIGLCNVSLLISFWEWDETQGCFTNFMLLLLLLDNSLNINRLLKITAKMTNLGACCKNCSFIQTMPSQWE